MLEHNVLVVVADGRRARIFRNSGTIQNPNLEILSNFEQKNPPTHEQGTDKPGSVFSSSGSNHSHVTNTDFHDEQEKLFAKDIIRSVSDCITQKNYSGIIWVLPPRMLSKLRIEIPRQLQAMTLRELDKDLTKHSPIEIVKIIAS